MNADPVEFVKGHGTENDFVVIPDPDGRLDLRPTLVEAICDRRAGIGADGVLRVVRAVADSEGAAMAADARWFMDYRNADGSVAEMCGNGIRVFARFLVDAGLAPAGVLRVATRAGVRSVAVGTDGDVAVDMGPATLPAVEGVAAIAGGRSWPAVAVWMPNPHAVVFVADLADPGDLRATPLVVPGAAFPEGVNVEFVVDRGPGRVAMRVHERGVGETRSCGTGACAAAVATLRRQGGTAGAAPGTVVVGVPGGRLTVTVRGDGHVELRGPAVLVASGQLSRDWLAPLVAPAARGIRATGNARALMGVAVPPSTG